MIEQRYYDTVSEELQNQFLRHGLWTRAVAEAGGDNDAARSIYISLRVEEMIRIEGRKFKWLASLIFPGLIAVLALVWWIPQVRIFLMCALALWAFITSVFLMTMVPIATCQAVMQVCRESRMKLRH
jgi:hypothetical protein